MHLLGLAALLSVAAPAGALDMPQDAAATGSEAGLDMLREAMAQDLGSQKRPSSISGSQIGDVCKEQELGTNLVVITVFGAAGQEEAPVQEAFSCRVPECPEAMRKAGQWIFTTVVRSMLGTRNLELGKEPPKTDVSVVPPFGSDPMAPGGKEADQRSPFQRTSFRLEFAEVNRCIAGQLARNVCVDYQRDEEELLNGILRALDISGLYPREAVEVASKLGVGLTSIIHLSSSVRNSKGEPLVGLGCFWGEQAKQKKPQGALFLPSCPENAHHGDDEERPYHCTCDVGYRGEIESVGFETLDGPKSYVNECEEVPGFCDTTSVDDAYHMKLLDGSPARGVVGEEAVAECSEGYESTGLATCTVLGDSTGGWSPPKLCRFVPPKEPLLSCPKPSRPDLELLNCDGCVAVLPASRLPACACQARCGDGYKQWSEALQKHVPVANFTEAHIACLDVAYEHCPPEDKVLWVPDAKEGRRCVDKRSAKVIRDHDFCCPEAWGVSKPVDLEEADCTRISGDAECYRSQQRDGKFAGQPCCWRKAASLPSAEVGALCVPRGATATTNVSSEYGCAVSRRVPDAQWNTSAFPTCKELCKNSFKEYEADVVSTDCDNCVPGDDPDCRCRVACRDGTIRFGGGRLGPRPCDADGSFGDVPLCRKLPALPGPCSPPGEDGPWYAKGCSECEPGKECGCTVQCDEKHTAVRNGEVARKCVEVDAPVVPANCMQITDRKQCIGSKSASLQGGKEVPCCWRDGGFADSKTLCAPRGSSLISITHQPTICAEMKAAAWEPPFPECVAHCPSPFKFLADVVTNGRCDSCIPGVACGCSVSCAEGTEWYGGGRPNGSRICEAGSLGAAPVCGRPEPPVTCSKPEVKSAVATGCGGWVAGETSQTSQTCHVRCLRGFVDVRSELTNPMCVSRPAQLTLALCSHIHEEGECKRSAQPGAGRDGQEPSPCCWHPQGLAGSRIKCAPKGSELIAWVPASCARTVAAEWTGLPECLPKCHNSFREATNVIFKPSLEACDACVAGKPCDCQVECAKGTLHYGGGPLHGRNCREDQLDLGEAPLCSEPVVPEPVPVPCIRPSEDTLEVRGCRGCLPWEHCECNVRCPDSQKLISGDPGDKSCVEVDAELDEAPCLSIMDRDVCLHTRELDSIVPCCYHIPEKPGDAICAPRASTDIRRPAVACAQLKVPRWEPPLPECQPTCNDDVFEGMRGLRPQHCHGCGVGDGDACPCTVACDESLGLEHYGGPPPGPRPCPSSGHFEAPPICGPAEQPPTCWRSDIVGEGLTILGCHACTAGQEPCEPMCEVRCADRFMRADVEGSGREAAKVCREARHSPGNALCAAIMEKSVCVQSLQGLLPCIWQPNGLDEGICQVKGSPKITAVPEEGNFARLRYGRWEEMPVCMLKCRHDFHAAPDVEHTGCDACHVGQAATTEGSESSNQNACPCQVRCRTPAERFGGGSESGRACSEDHPEMEQPPLCLPKRPVTCSKPVGAQFHVTGCEDCEVGKDCGKGRCRVGCAQGYRLASGTQAEKECIESDVSDTLQTAECSAITDPLECLGSKEEVAPGYFEPCCFRALAFSYESSGQHAEVMCAAKGSSMIAWDQPPDDCSAMTEGVWDDMPVCEEKCRSNFDAVQHVEAKGCDDCTNSSLLPCDCQVHCTGETRPLTGLDEEDRSYPPDGPKRCLRVDGKVEFEPPPVCTSPCPTPDTAGGTLDVSGCTPESRPDGALCFPGSHDCPCIVGCAPGYRPVGGGTNFGNFRCDVEGRYTDLPVCRPTCERPDNQFKQLDTSDCSLCVADAPECECSLKCFKHQAGGGRPGRYVCRLLPGTNQEEPAQATWAVADRSLWDVPGSNWDQVPLCVSPIFVQAVDASNQKTLIGVTIEVFTEGRKIETRRTEDKDDGKVELTTPLDEITVVAAMKGYSPVTRIFKRSVNCLDSKMNCGMQLSLSKALQHGMLNPDGCHFLVDPAKAEWEMRAVLEWDGDPQDLDLWARNLDCYDSVAERYGCLADEQEEVCSRYKFTKDEYKKAEHQACSVRACMKVDRVTFFDRRSGKPRCPERTIYGNQFPKWVFFRSRYLTNMHQRVAGKVHKNQQTEVLPFAPEPVRTVVLGGFPANDVSLCGASSCGTLNDRFVERRGPPYEMNGHPTYWSNDGHHLIYFCKEDSTWRVGRFQGVFSDYGNDDCKALAHSAPGADLLDPSRIRFPMLWNGERQLFVAFEGAGVEELIFPAATSTWNPDNYMVLNVDKRTGYGPETITFHNAPPGLYQIAVNIFSRKDARSNIKDGNPTVTLYVGGTGGAVFECRIHPDCTNISRVWNVVNIRIDDAGEELANGKPTGKRRYYFRLLDIAENMQALHEVDLPTTDEVEDEKEKHSHGNRRAKQAQYFTILPGMDYDDRYLQFVCHGQCSPSPGYSQCLGRPPGQAAS